MTKVSLELGGKNPLVVCNDANLKKAVKWSCLSAFSNAGQRCSSASRIIVFQGVYDKFKEMFVQEALKLKLGIEDGCDLGPLVNERLLNSILNHITESVRLGSRLLAGGKRADEKRLENGFFLEPTILENINVNDPINDTELFGPVAQLYRASDFEDALTLANASSYGLTAAIHTNNLDRAMIFCDRVKAGTVTINGGTHGSEPHMPFGGFGISGNGSREPGTEAIDVYSELKSVCHLIDPTNI